MVLILLLGFLKNPIIIFKMNYLQQIFTFSNIKKNEEVPNRITILNTPLIKELLYISNS